MPLKVMHVIGATVAGGAERFVGDLVIALKGLGVDTSLFALSGPLDAVGKEIRGSLESNGVPFACGPNGPVRAGAVFSYSRFSSIKSPDIVHLHTPNTELAHALVSLVPGHRNKLTRTLHNSAIARSFALSWAYRRNKVPTSIACSPAAKAGNQWLPGEIKVINNGVRFDWPTQNAANRNDACEKLGLSPEHKHFVSIASMMGDDTRTAQKAYDTLIKAWQGVAENQEAAVLHLLGDGALRPGLEAQSDGDSSIRFHGIQANAREWLLASDVFVMPSRFEGLPIAGIEAVGTGVPCIFSDIAPLRQLGPPSCFWFMVDDVAALSKALGKAMQGMDRPNADLVQDLRSTLGIDGTAAQYLSHYKQIMAG